MEEAGEYLTGFVATRQLILEKNDLRLKSNRSQVSSLSCHATAALRRNKHAMQDSKNRDQTLRQELESGGRGGSSFVVVVIAPVLLLYYECAFHSRIQRGFPMSEWCMTFLYIIFNPSRVKCGVTHSCSRPCRLTINKYNRQNTTGHIECNLNRGLIEQCLVNLQ